MSTKAERRERRNGELLRAVADEIEAHPERWNQGTWGEGRIGECGSRCCIAGFGAAKAGWIPTRARPGLRRRRWDWADVMRPRGRRSLRVSDVAAAEFGFTDAEAAYLFSGGWTPAGWDAMVRLGDTPKRRGRLVARALRRLADGATVAEVTGYLISRRDVNGEFDDQVVKLGPGRAVPKRRARP